MWQVARRPKWIAALVLALLVAGVFGALGQWQWQRSLDGAVEDTRDTESAVALDSIAIPQSTITTDASGRMVSVVCTLVPSDDSWVTERNLPGGRGDWLIRHCLTPEGYSLAVAAGWVASGTRPEEPVPAEPGPVELVGRYVPTESPQESNFQEGQRSSVSVAELINRWDSPGLVYGGYVVPTSAPEGLEAIPTTPPLKEAALNWLNVFYALEWAIFALFAVYLWFRLVKDEWEREQEPSAPGGQP